MENEGKKLVMWPNANVGHYERAVQIAGIRSGVKDIEERLSVIKREIAELERLNDEAGKLEDALRESLTNSRRNTERLMWLYYNGVQNNETGQPTFEEWCASLDSAQVQKEAKIIYGKT